MDASVLIGALLGLLLLYLLGPRPLETLSGWRRKISRWWGWREARMLSKEARLGAREFQASVDAWARKVEHRHAWYPDGPSAPPWRCACGATKEHLP